MPTSPPDLEVIDGKGVIAMGILIECVKRIVASVIGRLVYDWLKDLFKDGD